MFGIKLKVLKRSGIVYDLNVAYSSQAFTPSLNEVIRGHLEFITIFGIKSKVLMRPLDSIERKGYT